MKAADLAAGTWPLRDVVLGLSPFSAPEEFRGEKPTDDSDVCEGIGIDYGVDRFEPVRSAVRENALWSLVILCSHGEDRLGDALEPARAALEEVVRSDANIFCVGFAIDALVRLARLDGGSARTGEAGFDATELLARLPLVSWEPLVPSGLGAAAVRAWTSRAQV